MSLEVLKEALAGVAGKVTMAPDKIPAGKALVGIQLGRDETRAGKFMESVDREWQTTGLAIAMVNGHVCMANPVFGRFTGGIPKVTAMHWVVCPKCGRRTPMPLAVWEAKDTARRQGVDIPREANGIDILSRHGSCPCGGKWQEDLEGEKAELKEFGDRVLRTFSEMPEVPAYVAPQAFNVTAAPQASIPGWEWLSDAMSRAGKGVVPFAKDNPGDVIVYNPGFWLGWVNNPHDTNLFWREDGKGRRHAAPSFFDPKGVDGL